MNPAFPVIFLTTLIGVGQGLFLALYGVEMLALTGVIAAPDARSFGALGSAISMLFLSGGLVASFLHLGHPERAWRAVAMWRTSWLSREVIVLPLFMMLVSLYGLTQYFGWHAGFGEASKLVALIVGVTAFIVCGLLFVCTGMIYACIRFLQEWASPLTLVNYFLLGVASGCTLAAGFAALTAPQYTRVLVAVAIVLTLAGFVSRSASLYRNARLKPKSTLQTATGIRHPKIVQKAQGAMGGSFNTREFFHRKSPQFFRSIKWIFLVLVFPAPVVLLEIGLEGAWIPLLLAAFIVQYAGLIAERWFFFAQANHPQNLYYQQIS